MAAESRGSAEQPSTYMVQNRSNQEEVTRLRLQDQASYRLLTIWGTNP